MKAKDNKVKMNLQLLADDGVDNTNEVDGNESTDNSAATDDNNTNEKTFTQDELDKIVQDRIARETKKIIKEQRDKYDAERLESERLAQLTETERAKALADKREKELEEKEQQLREKEAKLERSELLNQTKDILADKDLATSFADILTRNAVDAEEINNNINNFEKEFRLAVEAAVTERLKGSSPKTGTKSNSDSAKDINKMSYKELCEYYENNTK